MVQFSSVLPFWKPLNVSSNIGNSNVMQNGFLPAPKSGNTRNKSWDVEPLADTIIQLESRGAP